MWIRRDPGRGVQDQIEADQEATSTEDHEAMGGPGVRILRGGQELSEALSRAARSEQRSRAVVAHRYGHYYGMGGMGGMGGIGGSDHGPRATGDWSSRGSNRLWSQRPGTVDTPGAPDSPESAWREVVRVLYPRLSRPESA